jgi:predicted pyridoxine 5'-phosphate oxidase superfamily flavin-nucleotide-binding protein
VLMPPVLRRHVVDQRSSAVTSVCLGTTAGPALVSRKIEAGSLALCRADTFTNVLENPRVGLIFFVPGKSETLRISGSAKIVRDADLRESMAARGKTRDFAMVLEVEEAFFHCSSALLVTLAALVTIYVARWWMALSRLRSLPPGALERAAAPGTDWRHWIHHEPLRQSWHWLVRNDDHDIAAMRFVSSGRYSARAARSAAYQAC